MLKNDKQAQILLSLLAEERGHPAQRFCPIGMEAFEGLELAQIVAGTVSGFIKGKIDDQLPSLFGVLQRSVWQFTDVLEEYNARPFSILPEKVMVLLESIFPLDPKLFEEHLAHAAEAIPQIIFAACLFNDRFGIDSRELNRDG